MTLYINPNARVLSPIFPSLIELDPTLAIRLGAPSLAGLSEGDPIAGLIAGGNGAARLRTFDAATNGWSMPTYTEAGGRPAMLFAGNTQIKNFAADSTIVGLPTPQTLFWTFLLPTYAEQQSSARLMSSGTTTPTLITIRPLTSGSWTLSTPTSNLTLANVAPAGIWATIGIVFDGPRSLLINAQGVVSGITLDAIPINGMRLGGNASSLSTGAPGLRGQISEFRAYSRAMSEDDLEATHALLAA